MSQYDKDKKLLEQLLADYQAYVWLIWESSIVDGKQVLDLTAIITSEEKMKRFKKLGEKYNKKRHPERELFVEKAPIDHWFGSAIRSLVKKTKDSKENEG